MNEILTNFSTKYDGNLSYLLEDTNIVDQNRKNLAKKMNFDFNTLVSMKQAHGNRVKIVDENSPKIIKNVDAIITKEKNLPLMVLAADCIPMLFYDLDKKVIAAVHSGRNSTFLKIAEETVKTMIDKFSLKSENISVIMGPSIQKCCYEVSDELINIVSKNFGKKYTFGKNIDLQGINKMLLENMGVKNIKISPICTKCSNEPYFSHRKKDKGRFAGIIEIRSI